MKTKSIIAAFIVAALSILISSCNKEEIAESGDICSLTVTIPETVECSTKVTGQTDAKESNIKNLQVFVFRDNGLLDASVYTTMTSTSGSASVNLKCTVGARSVWAVANAPSDLTTQIRDATSLGAITTNLKDNAADALLMVGSVSKSLTEGNCSVEIPVRRAAASIELEKISVAMESEAYKTSGAFKLKKIYLVNVCGQTNYALTLSPGSVSTSNWYGKLAEETSSPAKALISDDLATPVSIDNGTSYSTVHTFYAYPNNCAHSTSSTFSRRATLLVVEAELSGELYYYPLKFDSLVSNKRYVITNLTIKRPGSKTPYEPVLFSTASATVTVTPWDSSSRTEEI